MTSPQFEDPEEDLTIDDTVVILGRAKADGESELFVGERQCKICGCTEETPCAGGCSWVAPEICSSCVSWL